MPHCPPVSPRAVTNVPAAGAWAVGVGRAVRCRRRRAQTARVAFGVRPTRARPRHSRRPRDSASDGARLRATLQWPGARATTTPLVLGSRYAPCALEPKTFHVTDHGAIRHPTTTRRRAHSANGSTRSSGSGARVRSSRVSSVTMAVAARRHRMTARAQAARSPGGRGVNVMPNAGSRVLLREHGLSCRARRPARCTAAAARPVIRARGVGPHTDAAWATAVAAYERSLAPARVQRHVRGRAANLGAGRRTCCGPVPGADCAATRGARCTAS